ncbi:MAG: low molecular weight protein-tyrosine-phosphatase [Gemmatimonadales bacterium]
MHDLLIRVRRAPERLLQEWRRYKTREVLRGRSRPGTLLVVCRGNLCRSPFAAALLRQSLGPVGVRVDSAGFVRPSRSVPPEAVAAAARRGVDLGNHLSHLLTADAARAADLIVVMDPVQQRTVRERFGRAARDIIVLADLDPAPPDGAGVRTIRDPIGQGPDVFETSYARIERCVAALVSVLTGEAP